LDCPRRSHCRDEAGTHRRIGDARGTGVCLRCLCADARASAERAVSSRGPRVRSADGMSHPTISRRDFLNGMLIAAGGLAVGQSSPTRLLAGQRGQNGCDGAIGLDPRALRSGNLPSAFNVAHGMRDRRLTFSRTVVTLAKGCDADSGTFAIREDGGSYDVVIVGSGVSGLSTAFFLRRQRPRTRVLVLDANSEFGGNARRDDQPSLPVMASTAGSY